MQLISHPATEETLQKVAAALEAANSLKAAELAGTTGAAIYDSFYAANVTPENIDDMFVSWWHGADDGNYTKTQLLARWFNLLQSDKTFGVKFYDFATSQTTEGEFVEDSKALGAAKPSTNTVVGADPYCKQFAFWTVECEYEIDTNGEIEIKSVDKVDGTFTRAGTNGMVGVAQKSAWMSLVDDGVNWWKYYRTSRKAGYFPLPECVAPDGTIRAFMVHAKYMGGLDAAGKPTSATGLAPLNYTYSHNSQIAEWRKRGANYAGISICDIAFRIHMFQLKYGKKGNSGVLEGCTSYNVQVKAAKAETGVTRVLLPKPMPHPSLSARPSLLAMSAAAPAPTATLRLCTSVLRMSASSPSSASPWKALCIRLSTSTPTRPSTRPLIPTSALCRGGPAPATMCRAWTVPRPAAPMAKSRSSFRAWRASPAGMPLLLTSSTP